MCVIFRAGVLISAVCSTRKTEEEEEELLCENQHVLIAVDKRRISGCSQRRVALQLKPLSVRSASLCAQSFPLWFFFLSAVLKITQGENDSALIFIY